MPSISGNNKIVLKSSASEGGSEYVEGPLAAAAYPGMNLQMTPTVDVQGRQQWTPGGTDYVGTGTSKTASKGNVCILKEDSLQGRTVFTQYAAGDNAFAQHMKAGDHIQVLVAAGQTILKTDGLTAGVDGRWVGDTTNPTVEALEPSGGALAADTLVRARVL